jgi:hypothetical protein
MATPAQFLVVLGDEKSSVGADVGPSERSVEFTIPADAQLLPSSILQFMAHPSNEADDLVVIISMNDKQVYQYGKSSERLVRMFQVVLTGGNRGFPLQRGRNVLKIKKTDGDGAFGLSYFVIWFRQPASLGASRSASKKTKKRAVRKRKTKGR